MQAMILAIFIAVSIALFAAWDRTAPLNEKESPTQVKVIHQKKLCINNGLNCIQEIKASINGNHINIINKKAPWGFKQPVRYELLRFTLSS